jgi:hypothetical protein
MKEGDIMRLKTERSDAPPLLVTLIERSGRYAGWSVVLPSGHTGIALDSELLPLTENATS